MRPFQSKSIMITGGAAGLGLAVVRAFLDDGASVTIMDRSIDALRTVKESLPGVEVVVGDVTSYADNVRAAEAAVAAFGGIDVFVGNAGIFDQYASLADIPGESLAAAFDELLGIDVKGYILGAKAVAPHLAERHGCIIFTSSVSSVHPSFGGMLYVTAKHAISGLTKRLALELAPNVRVNAVAPGYIATKLGGIGALGHARNPEPPSGISAERFMLGFVPQPDDYAGIYTFLASSGARAITGTTILADSGSSIKRV
jgi:NAD(P)-dependent dehydrogenase (short-subunit alcohol dehydrogenase family)